MRPSRTIVALGLIALLAACAGNPRSKGSANGLVASLQLGHSLLRPGNEQEAMVQLVGGAGGLAGVQATVTYADGRIQHVDASAESGTVTLRWHVPMSAGAGAVQVQVVAQDVCGCSDRPRTGLGRQQFRVVP